MTNRIVEDKTDDTVLLAIVKGNERYVFHFRDDVATRSKINNVFGQFASNPELSFSWHDAAVLSQKVRNAV